MVKADDMIDSVSNSFGPPPLCIMSWSSQRQIKNAL